MEQGSEEWHQMRCGKVTASKVHDIIARTKSGPAASRANYMADLMVERLTGQPKEIFTSAAMQWGIDTEPQARLAYEIVTGASVSEIAFVEHPLMTGTGASPDGLVGDDGLVEIKCPNTATHIEALLGGTIPAKYRTQMLWQMACTGRNWCDYVSFDPRMPASMQICIQRVERDDDAVDQIEIDITNFLIEMEVKLDDLREKFERAEAA